jgi:hypothetical protein
VDLLSPRLDLAGAYRTALVTLIGGQLVALVMLLWSSKLPRA